MMMEKHIYDEENGLNYTLHGDYYLPDFVLNEEEPIYGKFGMIRRTFLQEHKSARYQYLVLTGQLTGHLNQIDQEVRERVEMIMRQMAETQGLTEKLKAEYPIVCVKRMNAIKNVVEEVGFDDIISEK